ncbi:Protein roadkill [Hordeum vulgare]|nr:Protein roadkill [Hordeum vulgare]
MSTFAGVSVLDGDKPCSCVAAGVGAGAGANSVYHLVVVKGYSDVEEGVEAKFSFSLVDDVEKQTPTYIRATRKTHDFRRCDPCWGCDRFMRRDALERSSSLKCDCFTIRCDIMVCKDNTQDATGSSTDTEITDMEAKVFRALLCFIYTDSCPEMEKESMEEDEMPGVVEQGQVEEVVEEKMSEVAEQTQDEAVKDEMLLQWLQDLFVAADRYNLRRLKFICEKQLCEHVGVRIGYIMIADAEKGSSSQSRQSGHYLLVWTSHVLVRNGCFIYWWRPRSPFVAELLWSYEGHGTYGMKFSTANRYPPLDISCSFLASYYNSYKNISLSVEDMVKGKSPVMELTPPKPSSMSTVAKKWPAPGANMVGLSTDGSFNLDDGTAGSGMILRDNKGDVIFASYRKLFQCNDALEAELQAIKEGLQLAFIHASLPVVLQSDSAVALKMIATCNFDRSPYGVLVIEIKSLLLNREVSFLKISREQNRVAHCLANFGRSGDSTACWLGRPPPCIIMLVAEDCKSFTV